jgi:hypothetical protein
MASTPRESELEAKLRERDAQVKALQQHVAELSERLSTDTSRTMDDVRAYTPAGHLLIPTAVQQRHSERFNGTHWLHTAASRSDLSDKDLFTRHFPAELTYWRTQHMPCLEQTQRMPPLRAGVMCDHEPKFSCGRIQKLRRRGAHCRIWSVAAPPI